MPSWRARSQVITLGVGVIVFVLAVVPPSVIWKINMFAFGGLETAFCWVLVGALFFKRANKVGAIASMVGGTAVYCLCMALGFKLFGLHQIVIGITVSLLCMVIGSWSAIVAQMPPTRPQTPSARGVLPEA